MKHLQDSIGSVHITSSLMLLNHILEMLATKSRSLLFKFLYLLLADKLFNVQLLLRNLTRIFDILLVTIPKKIPGIWHIAIQIFLYTCQEPPTTKPDTNLWAPFNVILIVLMASVLCTKHELLKLLVPLVHSYQKFSLCHLVSQTVNLIHLFVHLMSVA